MKPQELGDRQHIDMCVGVAGFPGWAGVMRESVPSQIPDNALWLGQNVRLWGGKVVTRGGQSKVNTLTIGAALCIEGVCSSEDEGAAG